MWRRERYPRKRGTRERRRTPPRLHHVSTVGRNVSKPFSASWSWTSCSQLLLVQRTRQGGVTDSATTSGKASPPLVSIPSSGGRPTADCLSPPRDREIRSRRRLAVSVTM